MHSAHAHSKAERHIVVDDEHALGGDPDPPYASGESLTDGTNNGNGSGGGHSTDGDAISSAATVKSSEAEVAPPPPEKEFYCTHSCASQNATAPPMHVDVDAESRSAPVTDLLSGGDFTPTDTGAAFKFGKKE